MPPTQRTDDDGLTGIDEDAGTDDGPPRASARAGQRGGAAPARRCIATMASRPQAEMIRFVLSPDGVVTPDLALRLPGRGAWVSADRAALDLAVKKNAFARAFKTSVKPSPTLSDEVDSLLARRVLDGLGLAKRAGDLLTGFDNVRQALREARPACLIEASDGSADGRAKVLHLSRAAWGPDRPDNEGDFDDDDDGDGPDFAGESSGAAESAPADDVGPISPHIGGDGAPGPENTGEPPVLGCFTSDELAMALGRERVIHACLRQGRLAQGWMGDLARLSGFRRVTPAGWRPEHRLQGGQAVATPTVGRQGEAKTPDPTERDAGEAGRAPKLARPD